MAPEPFFRWYMALGFNCDHTGSPKCLPSAFAPFIPVRKGASPTFYLRSNTCSKRCRRFSLRAHVIRFCTWLYKLSGSCSSIVLSRVQYSSLYRGLHFLPNAGRLCRWGPRPSNPLSAKRLFYYPSICPYNARLTREAVAPFRPAWKGRTKGGSGATFAV